LLIIYVEKEGSEAMLPEDARKSDFELKLQMIALLLLLAACQTCRLQMEVIHIKSPSKFYIHKLAIHADAE
jgi:hypothetical protein